MNIDAENGLISVYNDNPPKAFNPHLQPYTLIMILSPWVRLGQVIIDAENGLISVYTNDRPRTLKT